MSLPIKSIRGGRRLSASEEFVRRLDAASGSGALLLYAPQRNKPSATNPMTTQVISLMP